MLVGLKLKHPRNMTAKGIYGKNERAYEHASHAPIDRSNNRSDKDDGAGKVLANIDLKMMDARMGSSEICTLLFSAQ